MPTSSACLLVKGASKGSANSGVRGIPEAFGVDVSSGPDRIDLWAIQLLIPLLTAPIVTE